MVIRVIGKWQKFFDLQDYTKLAYEVQKYMDKCMYGKAYKHD